MHYAYLYQYLAEWAKIRTVYVTSEGANHAWNQTFVNGSWFNVDVTNMDLDEYGFRYTGYFMVSDSAYGVYKSNHSALYGRVGTVACTNQMYDSWTTNDWKTRCTA